MNETAVALFDPRGRRAIAFGDALRQDSSGRGSVALFGPGQIVAYVVERSRWRSVYVFRTAGATPASTRIDGVSVPVDLFFVCSTARAARKALVALRALAGRIGPAQIQSLSDLFWMRLSAAIFARGTRRIVPQLASLLHRERLQL